MRVTLLARDESPAFVDSQCSRDSADTVGTGCEHDGVIYRNGQSFQPSCKYQCVCVNGAVGCVPLCTESRPPRVWCQNPRRVKVRGRCCDEWICDEPKRGRKTAPRHVAEAPPAELSGWHKNCVSRTTSWSPCSKTCGRGLSLRVSNANRRCEPVKESRLCNLRPCDVDIAKTIKVPTRTRGQEVRERVPRGARIQHEHLGLHQHQAVPAQVLRRVHGRALLHPAQVQDGGRGVRVPRRLHVLLEDDVGAGLLLQPQLQEPQRHLRRAGELLRLPRGHELSRPAGLTPVPQRFLQIHLMFVSLCPDKCVNNDVRRFRKGLVKQLKRKQKQEILVS
ncbi:cellular communication network factor 4a isoform X3 [Phycodurus eques]|uniref:cellular communication network factor 4a isoform X3 n=1 Tax=Phycodurus eques TaxID=693459 RepID=UPI002ACE64EB|nr:cellular communication network factor 4a isoform X3 [Phycodurus eques]